MNNDQLLTLNRKALTLNLDKEIYGTFAEIGAGQEVARYFFQAGGASGTIAKTMCAYDMKFSDEIYGKSRRYVSRERLGTMLNHEYGLLIERLGEQRGDQSCFFAFANTVAATSYGSTRDGEGWLGIRFQSEPGGAPNEIIIHCRLLDTENPQQQQAVGGLGVNLIYAAFFYKDDPKQLINSLLDHLGAHRVEVDMISFTGPKFEQVDNRLMALQLVRQGLTNAILFNADGLVMQPSEVLYKKAILVERGSFRPVTNVSIDMIDTAREAFDSEENGKGSSTVVLMEMTINNLLRTGEMDHDDFLARVDTLGALGFHVLISNYPEYYRLASYFRRYTQEKLGITMGINNLVEIFNEKYYTKLDGGILEAFGRLFKNTVKLYIYPMHRDGLQHYRRFAMLDEILLAKKEHMDELPEIITADNLFVDDHLKHLYQYLLKNDYIHSLDGYNVEFMNVFSRDVLEQISQGDPNWENLVPQKVADLIKTRGLFGYK